MTVTDEMISAGMRAYHKHLGNSEVLDTRQAFAEAFGAALAAAPTPPAREVEPIAFQITLPDGRVFYRGVPTFLKNHTNMPLYTRPQSDELRKVAKETADYLEVGSSSIEYDNAIRRTLVVKLRLALEKTR